MATLAELTRLGTGLSTRQLLHLQRLASWWGLLADLSFADLLLFAPLDATGRRFTTVSQIRPTTGQTLYQDDHVGVETDDVDRPLVARAFALGEVVEGEVRLPTGRRARVLSIPVLHEHAVIGVLSREVSPDFAVRRDPGELERQYLDTFQRFARMIAAGRFPYKGEEVDLDEVPRVGDGMLLLDPEARVLYASPNALSTLHRVGVAGNVVGKRLGQVGLDQAPVGQALTTSAPASSEVERNDVTVQMMVLPMFERSRPEGLVVLVRDVSELRRRDRLLLSKDATIREIHHRVKNNLQTISSLLRLQGRRLASDEAKQAIEESVRRIGAIAFVHETLANESADDVNLREVVTRLVSTIEDGYTSAERSVLFSVDGDVGEVNAEVVTPLAVVLNELLQNAVDHAFPGRASAEGSHIGSVEIVLERADAETLTMKVRDDGVGLAADFDFDQQRGLGTSIVRALANSELGGSFVMQQRGDGPGSEAVVTIPVDAKVQ
ncbi:MAG: sensor histidine kinase [Actinomycetota bacterium]|jgi:two-component system, sensor histidine kinase PdtaS|nr:sensor histidine kinase [Actinomycetota bacterium]